MMNEILLVQRDDDIATVILNRPEKLNALNLEVFKEIAGMLEKPMTQEELQKSKDSLANSIPAAFETSQNAVNSFSNIFVYDLGLDYYTRYAQQVNAVTAAQALDVAKRYIVPDRLVVIAVGDRKAIEADLRKLNLGGVEIRDAEGRPVS